MKSFVLFISSCVFFSIQVLSQADVQKKLQKQLILADAGAVIELPEGVFEFTNTLSLEEKKKITIRGKGMNKTILSFKGQTDGAEGVRVSNCDDIILEGFSVLDAKGDAIKTMHVNKITFRDVKTAWTGTPGPANGGYGFYPVQCDGVVIDQCEAMGASDAGIYVGQSKNIVVKNSKAYYNVAGIEIENSQHAEVVNNEAYQNTGGVLVFDLPDLVQKKGGDVNVHDNYIHDNNFPNFAPKGNIVASVPTGTGILILATKNINIFKNKIINNQSVSTGIISYFTTGKLIKDKLYDPYPSAISIYDNQYERQVGRPVSSDPLGMIVSNRFKENTPHIIFDGIKNPALLDASGNWTAGNCISILNNTNQSIVNLDAGNLFKDMAIVANEKFNCSNK